MNDVTEKIIHLQWAGPFVFNEATDFTNRQTDYGVYQVCGPHTAYGPDSLLYVGKADRQTFGVRLSQEKWEGWQKTNGAVRVFLGRPHGSRTPTSVEWSEQIDWGRTFADFGIPSCA